MKRLWLIYLAAQAGLLACSGAADTDSGSGNRVKPVAVTHPVEQDSDDPAIWIHPAEPEKSLILGTDKGGTLFAFDLQGQLVKQIQENGMMRLNNVDVEYGFRFSDREGDIAVVTDRDARRIYAFDLPELRLRGSIAAFAGETERRPMGVALFKRGSDGAIFAIVSRKGGPSGSYLWQYALSHDGDEGITFRKVRAFGAFSGVNDQGDGEIEAIAVDDELGYVYYSDELYGVRKYHADPDAANSHDELAVFGTSGFENDREGIAIYRTDERSGYILVSDQQANQFRVFRREGSPGNDHEHTFLSVLNLSTSDSDGSEAVASPLGPGFPQGLFVAMSNDRTYQYYDWREIRAILQGN